MDTGEIIKMKRKKIIIILASVITVFIILFIFTSCMGPMGGAFTNSPNETQDGMETYEVVRGNISQEISVTGSVDSENYTTYNLQVSGRILAAVEAGDTFKKGDLLVEIDDKDKEDSLFEIEKNIETSESLLRTAKINYQESLDKNHIAVQLAELNNELAQQKVEAAFTSLEEAEENLKIVKEDTLSTDSQVASARFQVNSAESSYEQSLNSQSSTYWNNLSSLQSAEAAIAQAAENLKQAEIKLELVRAEYENAKEDMGEYTVYAPYDGIMISSDFAVGGEASGSGSISIISSEFVVDCMISESDIVKISIGQAADVDFDAYPDVVFSGKVENIIPIYTEDSGIVYYEALVSFDNTEDVEILYGLSSNISIIDLKAENVLYVPLQAIYKEEDKSYVDVLISGPGSEGEAGQAIQKTEITTGVNDYYNIEVTSGLNEGDIIVTSRI